MGLGIGLLVLLVIAAVPALTDFNTNQFDTTGTKVSIKSGARFTNAYSANFFTANYAEFTNNVQVDGQLDVLGTLNLQGSGVSALSQNGTNGASAVNFTNSPTVTWARSGSNWTATAAGSSPAAPVNNFYATNNYVQNGNHNTMIVTQYVRLPWTTLTMSGSNISSMDFAAASMFKVTLTNAGFLVAPSNLPGTNVAQVVQVHIAQDGTGGRSLTATNGSFVINGSGTSTNAVLSISTNANAISVLTLVTSPFDAAKVYGTLVTTP